LIERVHIQLLNVMSGYTVRGTFARTPSQLDDPRQITVMHGWIGPVDLESSEDVLEHLAEELYNLAPRFRVVPARRTA